MQLNDSQLDEFTRLYKEELGVALSRVEALEKAQALLRYLEAASPKDIPTDLAD